MFKKQIILFLLIIGALACKNQQNKALQPTPTPIEPEEERVAQIANPSYYICYTSDNNEGLGLSIAFDEQGTALHVQYRGQAGVLELKKGDEKMSNEDGPYPVIEATYQEIVDDEVNGTYLLTHAGIWDYVQYTRGRDKKVFSFTIDHELSIQNDTYRTTACY